jgi:hypothetical protein
MVKKIDLEICSDLHILAPEYKKVFLEWNLYVGMDEQMGCMCTLLVPEQLSRFHLYLV